MDHDRPDVQILQPVPRYTSKITGYAKHSQTEPTIDQLKYHRTAREPVVQTVKSHTTLPRTGSGFDHAL